MITYDISPYRGSEASVSWNFVDKMRKYVDITVFYGDTREEVERYLSGNPMDNVEWVNVPRRWPDHVKSEFIKDIYHVVYYRRWHKDIYRLVKEKVDNGEIDFIHYLSPIGFKEPGLCWKIKSVPYVWGPVQGVENRPLCMYRAFTFKGKVLAFGRRLLHNGAFRLIPSVRKAFRRADAIFAATPGTVRGLKRVHGLDVMHLPENGILAMERSTPVAFAQGDTLRLICIGAIIDRKALVILLDALRKVKSDRWHLDVVGDGPLRTVLQARYADLSERVVWHGKVPRDKAQEIFSGAHLHVLPSLGEGNPTTIWEAMSKGIPTMTLDHCGMSGVVCPRCGIKIPIDGYENVTTRMAGEIDDLVNRPERIGELSAGVIECSRKFMWDNRIGIYRDTYAGVSRKYKVQ